jgi:excisionase family DNA binding protein
VYLNVAKGYAEEVAGDLSDVEAARLVGKHRRTIQRWCLKGKLPGCYKAGRSWRIPPAALRTAGLGKALEPDSVAAELAAAEALVESLLAELSDAAQRKRPPLVARDWRSVAASARRLATASRRLHELAGAAHQRFGT